MSSREPIEERMGKTKVSPAFFKKLGEKLRNHRKYEKPDQLYGATATSSQSLPLDVNEGIKLPMERLMEMGVPSVKQCSAKPFAKAKLEEGDETKKRQSDEKGDDEGGQKLDEADKKKEIMKSKNKKPINKKHRSPMGIEHYSLEQVNMMTNVAETLEEGCRPVTSRGDINQQSLEVSISDRNSSPSDNSQGTSPKNPLSMAAKIKSVSNFQEGIQTDFQLDNDNILSILTFKNNPNTVIYQLRNTNGCKIYLEKKDNRAILMSDDGTGKRLYIGCNF